MTYIVSPELQKLFDSVDDMARVYRAGGVPEDQLKDWVRRRKYAVAREHWEPNWKNIAAWRSKFTSMLLKKRPGGDPFLGRENDRRITKTCDKMCGCSWQHLRDHIQRQFRPGMTWENHGKGREDWVLDHIKPICMFDWWKPEGLKEAFHWSNVQPLWYIEHRAKSAEDKRLARARKFNDEEYRKRLPTGKALPPLEGTDAEILAQLERQLSA